MSNVISIDVTQPVENSVRDLLTAINKEKGIEVQNVSLTYDINRLGMPAIISRVELGTIKRF